MEDDQKVYDEFLEHAMHLLNDHQFPVELVAGTMMAIAQRLYRTNLSKKEYDKLMETIKDYEVEPYHREKVRLH